MSEAPSTSEAGRFISHGWTQYSWSIDTMEVLHRNGCFAFEIDEPWAGDTETGFGQSCDLTLNAEQAKALADWIYAELAHLSDKQKPASPT